MMSLPDMEQGIVRLFSPGEPVARAKLQECYRAAIVRERTPMLSIAMSPWSLRFSSESLDALYCARLDYTSWRDVCVKLIILVVIHTLASVGSLLLVLQSSIQDDRDHDGDDQSVAHGIQFSFLLPQIVVLGIGPLILSALTIVVILLPGRRHHSTARAAKVLVLLAMIVVAINHGTPWGWPISDELEELWTFTAITFLSVFSSATVPLQLPCQVTLQIIILALSIIVHIWMGERPFPFVLYLLSICVSSLYAGRELEFSRRSSFALKVLLDCEVASMDTFRQPWPKHFDSDARHTIHQSVNTPACASSVQV